MAKRMKPIPKKVLIHTVTYEQYLGEDDWSQTEQYAAPLELKCVRIQYSSDLKRTGNAENKFYKSMMLYDMKNSLPVNVQFVEKSKITFNGDTMFIKEVQPVYAFTLHHYELVLE